MKSIGSSKTRLLTCIVMLSSLFHAPNAKALDQANKQGSVDLRDWPSDETRSLKGEWHFFWKELLSPAELVARLQSPGYQPVIGTVSKRFQELRNDGGTDDIGYAIYAVILHDLPKSLHALAGLSAYNGARLYLFQAAEAQETQPLATLGVVGTIKESSRPATTVAGQVNFSTEANQTYYPLVQVSNFHLNWGGLWTPQVFGSDQSVAAHLAGNERITYLTMGMFLILFLYNSSFYLRHQEVRASLYLALFCLVIIVCSFTLITWSLDVFSNFERSYDFNFKSIYLTQVANVLMFMLFMRACFPQQTPVWLAKLFLVVYMLPILLTLTNQPTIYSNLSNFFKIAGFIVMPILMFAGLRAVIAREDGARASLTGSLIFLFGALLDIGATLGWWTAPGNMTGIGLVIFGCFQSQIVAIRFALAFRKSEHLGRALGEEVERQTRDIKSILKNIRQGIFTLVPPLKKNVGEQYSDHLLSLLGKTKVTGLSLDQLLLKQSDLSGDTKNQIETVLDASMGRIQYGLRGQ